MAESSSILKVVNLSPHSLPHYATSGSAGADLTAWILGDDIILQPSERMLVSTGLYLGIPEGHEAQVRPRSGLALKHGITVLNSPGTIDADYRGEVKVLLVNLGKEPFTITNGMRIAQMVIAPYTRVDFMQVDELEDTGRGAGGYGSTGH